MSQPYRGLFTIPSTPFDEQGQLDLEGLRRVIDFCVGCGAHGIVYPVNASEFSLLSDAERVAASRIVVEAAAGRIPVVLGVQGLTAEHAAYFSREAAAMGADAVIAMAPYVRKLTDEAGLLAYYDAIARAAGRPVFIPNHAVGSELSVATMARLIRELEWVDYVKEETLPATHKLTQLLAAAGPKLKGVFGGAGGRYLLLEHPRGSAGQMPGCHLTDVEVRLWDALEAGNGAEAKRIYGLLAPVFAIEEQCRGAIYKEVLVRRGVIHSAYSRGAAPDRMDAEDHRALGEILTDLALVMTWRGF